MISDIILVPFLFEKTTHSIYDDVHNFNEKPFAQTVGKKAARNKFSGIIAFATQQSMELASKRVTHAMNQADFEVMFVIRIHVIRSFV